MTHLVVELKAPRVKIGADEIAQIQGYAFTVMKDPRFSKVGVNWHFWVISDELTPYAEELVQNDEGMLLRKRGVNIYAKTWAQVLDENRARLQFFQDKLDLQVDRSSSLKFLQQRYATYLGGVFDSANGTLASKRDAVSEKASIEDGV